MTRVAELALAAVAGGLAIYAITANSAPKNLDDCILANSNGPNAGMVVSACLRKFPKQPLDFSAESK
jgi:hypothetical protein